MTTPGGGFAGSRLRAQRSAAVTYYRTLLQRKWLILACVAVTVVAAAIYVKTAPRKYAAEAQMQVSPVPADDSLLIGLPVLHSSGEPTNDVLTAANLITSTAAAAATVNALHLHETPSALLANIQATPIGQSNLISLRAQASSASEAQQLANTFASQVVATRAAALHAAIKAILPGLRAQAATQSAAAAAGPTSVSSQISSLEQLSVSNDPTITLASPATRPGGPYTPRTSLALAAGLFGGLILGMLAAFVSHALDPRLRREEQLSEVLAAPILARIPREMGRTRSRPLLPSEMSFGGSEGYRTLRTVLTSRAGNDSRAYLVTGSSPSEGKTTSAIGLAASLTQGGYRVMLIEADLRRPTIGEALDLGTTTYGTEHVLIGAVDLSKALAVARFDGKPLQVLAVHKAGTELVDRLSFPIAQRLIARARQLADFVVIDSPPITDVGDALTLAPLVDEVLVVARLGNSRLTKLADLQDMLSNQGTFPSGVVLIGGALERGVQYYDYGINGDVPQSGGRRTRVPSGERRTRVPSGEQGTSDVPDVNYRTEPGRARSR